MITPGLSRITRLLQNVSISWRAIHVAGTNGKGSICAYVSAMLGAAGLSCGRFTSPHLIDRWDCINVNGKAVRQSLFQDVEARVHAKNKGINASEFEVLTATAFELFQQEKVQVGIVEVGMGGKDDATNVIQNPYATVISKIGMDHQAYLGDSIKSIAHHKAGIMKHGVPCVIDDTIDQGVMDVLEEAAAAKQVPLLYSSEALNTVRGNLPRDTTLEEHQVTNLALAYLALDVTMQTLGQEYDIQTVLNAAIELPWPGRLQTLDLSNLAGRSQTVLLDGAHNVQSAEVLKLYVDRQLRSGEAYQVTWLMALSKGKDIREILKAATRPGDRLVAMQFGPVDGMPWVHPASTQDIQEAASQVGLEVDLSRNSDLKSTLIRAAKMAKGPVVIAGSLYLVSDVLRLLR